MLAAATMLVSGLVVALRTWRRPAPAEEAQGAAAFFRQVTPLPIVVLTAMIAAYMVALQPLGFVASTFVFLLAAILYLFRRGLLVSLLLSAGSLLAIWLLFRKVFTVVLPSGSLWPAWLNAWVTGL